MLSITLYMIAVFSIALVFNVTYLFTSESIPTEVRSMGFSMANSMARLGACFSPFVAFVVSNFVISIPC